MSDVNPADYPGIYLSKTDTDLPDNFSNGFSKYTNISEMESGGNGVLLLCYDSNLERQVVIKKLLASQASDARARRRLLREARVTAQLAHPNTVPVYEIGKADDGQLYFAMKRIQGQNLFRILSSMAKSDQSGGVSYTLDELLEIMVQTGYALAYAHSRGVIHRDIKPENILVGRFGDVHLMDWGVAKVWGMAHEGHEADFTRSELEGRLTAPGKRPGTPLYMSPEQINDRMIDERTDIFSMGVVLYEMLALQEPFRGGSVNATFRHILHSTPPPPSEVSKHLKVPERLDEICARAMQKKAKDRYQSMLEMINDIRSFRDEGMMREVEE
ncbi:MAG: serine/threonine protein kinase [bacterium]|nr:serine/threonine protein kinase [bacterium]